MLLLSPHEKNFLSVSRPVEGSITFPNLAQHNVTAMHCHRFEHFMIQLIKSTCQIKLLKLWITCTGQHRCWNHQSKLQFSHQIMFAVRGCWRAASWGGAHIRQYSMRGSLILAQIFYLSSEFVLHFVVVVCLFLVL